MVYAIGGGAGFRILYMQVINEWLSHLCKRGFFYFCIASMAINRLQLK